MASAKRKHWLDRVGKERFIPLTNQERKEIKELQQAVKQLRKVIHKTKKRKK